MELQLKAQTKWRWLLAIDLFLSGVGGGAYLTGVVADLLKWDVRIAKIGIFIGFPLVFIGTLFLMAELGSPKNFWRAFMKPGTSWIARGTIITTFFMIINFFHIVFWIFPYAATLENAVGLRHLLGIVGVIFALGRMIYAGILLAACRPIAFWSTGMLPLLFLVSALSTGIMSVLLISSIPGFYNQLGSLVKFDILLLALEIFVLLFYLQATHRLPESRASAKIVLRGSVAPLFWFGVVILGLAIPLALFLLALFTFQGTMATIALILGTICGMVGCLILIQVILLGGIHAPLKAGRFEYALTNV